MPHDDAPLAWVESPLQMIGAAEWAAAHRTRVDLAARLAPQVEKTAGVLNRLDAQFGEQAGYYGIPWRTLRRHDHWLVGDGFSGQFRLAAAVLRPRRLTFLDDGLATLDFVDAIGGARPLMRPGVAERAVARRLAPLALDAIRLSAVAGDAGIFTTFDLGEARAERLRELGVGVQHHAFEWLRAAATRTPAADAVREDRVILGSARVVDGHMPRTEYLQWVRDSARGADTAYLPHRREEEDVLAAVAALPRVRVVRTGLPIELVLAGRRVPREIVTLPTSAAATLRRVLEGSPVVLRERPLVTPARATR